MKPSPDVLSSLDVSWARFSREWKTARKSPSEKSVHALRIALRRLSAAVELLHALRRHKQTPALQKSLEKVLDRTGALRDMQVQLKNLSRMEPQGILRDLQRRLQRRERQRLAAMDRALSGKLRRRIKRGVRAIQSAFVSTPAGGDGEKVREAVARLLRVRENEFLRTRKRFKPEDEKTLHAMRIAAKKVRYVTEAAGTLADDFGDAMLLELQRLQRLLGDVRDNDLLHGRLERWASKRGRMIAVVPALRTLEEKREELMRELAGSVAVAGDAESAKPLLEKTLAVPQPLRPRLGNAGRPSRTRGK